MIYRLFSSSSTPGWVLAVVSVAGLVWGASALASKLNEHERQLRRLDDVPVQLSDLAATQRAQGEQLDRIERALARQHPSEE